MGENQGAYRLRKGFTRQITASEATRGYFYVTKDRTLDSMLKGKGIDTIVNGMFIGRKSTDSCGRITLHAEYLGKSEGRSVSVKIADGKLVIDFE